MLQVAKCLKKPLSLNWEQITARNGNTASSQTQYNVNLEMRFLLEDGCLTVAFSGKFKDLKIL